jgi:hypothetical protein
MHTLADLAKAGQEACGLYFDYTRFLVAAILREKSLFDVVSILRQNYEAEEAIGCIVRLLNIGVSL